MSISNSYWNTQTSSATTSIGEIQAPEFLDQEGTSLSTVQMQSPLVPGTASTEAYYNWSVADWDFGNSTQYPAVCRSDSSALVSRRASLASLTVQAGEGQVWHLDIELMQHDIAVDFGKITVTTTTATPAAIFVFVNDELLSNGKSRAIDLEILRPRCIRVVLVPYCCTTAILSDLADSVSTRTYIVTVVRQLSVDLRDLSISSGDLVLDLKPKFLQAVL